MFQNNPIDLSDRQKREANFFDEEADKLFSSSKSGGNINDSLLVDEIQAIAEYPDYYKYAYKLLGDLKGKRVLDIGCGNGKSSVILAKKGATVSAFDVSPKSIEVTKLRAKVNGVADNIVCTQMTAEALTYDSNSFDAVFGIAILHHIDMQIGGKEIFRVLKKGGQAIFIEPIAFSPLIRTIRNSFLFRAFFPNKGKELMITDDERQLYNDDLEFLRKIFKSVDYRPFELFSRLDRLIGGYPVTRNKWLVSLINQFDRILLDKYPFLAKFGRWGVIQLIK